jgi:CopA family copper-resistance protein
LAIAGSLAGLGLLHPSPTWALTSPGQPTVLGGTDFALEIVETPGNFTGVTRPATTVNGGIPGPILRWKEGTTVTLRVTNRLRMPTSIHWHGIVVPFQMDGVPGISFDGIAPGETFVYQFKVCQSGTYWYHSHNRFQEQVGHYGALVIDPAGPDRNPSDRDYVVMLNDWTDEDPERVYAKLKKKSDYYNFAQPTAGDFFRDVSSKGLNQALAMRKMWNEMRMNPTDLSDVSGYTYTYLMNGTTPVGNWSGQFRPGEKIRLRFINGSSSTIFDVRIPGLKMTVVSADGQDIEPVAVDEFRISVAETYDVIVEPQDERAYTLFAQAIDRTRAKAKHGGRGAGDGSAPLAEHAGHDGRDAHGRLRGTRHAWHDRHEGHGRRLWRVHEGRLWRRARRYGGHGSRRDARHGDGRRAFGASCPHRIWRGHRHARRHAAHESRRSRHRPARQRPPCADLRRPAHDRRSD